MTIQFLDFSAAHNRERLTAGVFFQLLFVLSVRRLPSRWKCEVVGDENRSGAWNVSSPEVSRFLFRAVSSTQRQIQASLKLPHQCAGACRISWLASRVSPGANLTFNCQHYFQHCIQNTKFALSHTFTFTGAPMCHPISGLFPFCTATQ